MLFLEGDMFNCCLDLPGYVDPMFLSRRNGWLPRLCHAQLQSPEVNIEANIVPYLLPSIFCGWISMPS